MEDSPRKDLPRNLTLTFSIEEVNQILDALGQQPFKQVFQLISKIQEQSASQLQANQQ